MISSVATIFGISIFVFIALLIVVKKECRRGRRFFAEKLRSWIDIKIDIVSEQILISWDHFIKYIVQLHWYYSIHSVLRAILHLITAFYTYFEDVFERNRKRAKVLRAEKRQLSESNHLRQMAEHKEGTALTPAQKRKLRERKLEDKH